ncbi:DNA alkylation repair protein [Jeotgalibacillus sp. ET6]|uniref:DNA alkylation repair protein n=1 Tax=Jeotgalibacillus sp. ET6 TaxID=3037260 RepID=UPI0024185B12|nr:DNA alkylation repair protein [Jeotgalibacillus sp. ET6]MDG5471837.1 DNA alkylation repair protein [Jeotgalibacillus sp. ET6]
MNLNTVMGELEALGTEQTKKTFMRHGAKEPFYGVKVGDLKKWVKHVKKDQELVGALYDTGNSDAMYLAGLAADPKTMSKETLEKWVKGAYWHMIAECTVAWVAAESPYAVELAKEWMASDEEMIAAAGWSTYSSYLSIAPDEKIDADEVRRLLQKVRKTIHSAPNRVRYTMNGFVIAAGAYLPSLTEEAKEIAGTIGKVQVDVGNTACKVPFAPTYIENIESRGKIGVKKKTARC